MFTIKQNWTIQQQDEALVIGLPSEKEYSAKLNEIDQTLKGHIAELIREGDISTKVKAVTKIHTFGIMGAKRLYFVGLGKKDNITYESIRDCFGKAVQELSREKRESVGVLLDTFECSQIPLEKLAHALAESVITASYKFDDYKEKSNERERKITSINIYSNKGGLENGLASGLAYGLGINKARDLVNTPGNLMTPSHIAQEAIEVAQKYNMEYEVLEQEDLERLGMGLLLAVSKGSSEKPKLITVKYKGRETWENVLCFVGKGVTFDSGGYSIKPAQNMHEMKGDMGGSAAVIGAMEVVGKLKPEANMMFVIPTCENLINGSAMKPGDVFTSLSGKTVEVRNTDAEGRLILGDAITYAKEQGANFIVDVATLTGGVVVALGDCTTGVMTNNEAFYKKVEASAKSEGELVWLLPSFKPFKDMLKTSDVADLNNSTGRLGHAITGGLFVGEFAGNTPWVHLDIAGTSYSSKSTPLGPKGATGVMVRTLSTLARTFS